jgi:opacity protein-like surface antigen
LKRKVTAILAAILAGAACLLLGTPVHAQDRGDDDRSDAQEDRTKENFALAVGVGLADVDSVAETYLTAALRIRLSGRGQEDDSHDWRGRPPESGVRGYLEPEVGYWKASGKNGTGSDLLLGANLVAVIPVGSVDTYIGAGVGAHRLDAALLRDPTGAGKQTKVGVNAQFGLDLYLTRSVSLFGTGRFDLVQDVRKSVQAKAYLGVRARF